MAFKRGNEVTRWLTIEKIATKLYRGFGIKKDQAIEGVGYPCVRYGWIHISNLIYFDKCQFGIDETLIKNKRYASKGDILFAIISENTNDIEKAIAYIGEKDILVGDGVVVMKHNQNPKYLAYALSTTNAQKQKSQGKIKLRVVNSGVPHIKKLTLPIPSLAKQEEIVNLLDKFWKLSKELEKELEKELNLRKQQYEYYRDELLSFKQDNKIEWLALKDICNLQAGYGFESDKYKENGEPILRVTSLKNNQIDESQLKYFSPLDYSKDLQKHKLYPNEIVISKDGTIGKVAFNNKDRRFYLSSQLMKIIPKKIMHTRYLFHFLIFKTKEIEQMTTGKSAILHLNLNKFKELKIPVPSLEKQQEIVDLLDKFWELSNNIKEGLPTEILMRKQQYEYYRDELLKL